MSGNRIKNIFKGIGMALVAVFLLLVCLEIILAVRQRVAKKENPYSRETLNGYAQKLRQIGLSDKKAVSAITAHPYLGYICNFDTIRPHKGKPNNRSGFFSDVDANYRPKDSNEFVVVMLGGSVAAQLCIVGEEHLKAGLQEIPAIRGREIVINSLAQGGYKQPHQLLNFAYHRSLGMHADLVINMDGVNEMLFFWQNSAENRIDPSYPWNWLSLAPGADRDVEALRAQLAIADMRIKRAKLAGFMLKNSRYRSVLARALYRRLDKICSHGETRAELRFNESLVRVAERGLTFPQTGPVYWQGDDFEDIQAESARLWRRASIALSDLVQAQGIPYLHALQPNQYFPGTRTLTDWEKKNAYHKHSHFYKPLHYGYAFFTNEAPNLLRAGVPFVNISDHLGDPPDTIYEDNFSHLNKDGNKRLARAVVEQVKLVMERHAASSTD